MEEVFSYNIEGDTVYAVLHRPQGLASEVGIVMLSALGYRVGNQRFFVQAARSLERSGFPVLRTDLRGYGDSTGSVPAGQRYAEQRERRFAEEVKVAARLLQGRCQVEKVVLLGECGAGRYALQAAQDCPEVAGMILLSTPMWTEEARLAYMAGHEQGIVVRKLLSAKRWKRLMLSPRELLEDCKRFAAFLRGLFPEARKLRKRMAPQLVAALLKVLQSGCQVLALYGSLDVLRETLIREIKENPKLRRYVERGALTCEIFSGADHDFLDQSQRDRVLERCEQWLVEKMTAVNVT
jgi:pimeloyl-ACP methyl ester carboxylesterase